MLKPEKKEGLDEFLTYDVPVELEYEEETEA